MTPQNSVQFDPLVCASPYGPHFPLAAAKSGTRDIPAQPHHFVGLSGQTCAFVNLYHQSGRFYICDSSPRHLWSIYSVYA